MVVQGNRRLVAVGIDPGLDGALAAVLGGNGRSTVLETMRMPVLDRRRRKYDTSAVAGFIRRNTKAADAAIVLIEYSIRFPKLAEGVGFLRAAADLGTEELDVEVELVAPSRWKAYFRIPGGKSGKEASIRRVSRMPGKLPQIVDHNTADAVMIALYGLTKLRREGV